jgi:hypothetical protein
VPKWELQLIRKEIAKKKMFALAALAFLLTAGSAAVLTIHPQPAMACSTPSCT